jgi:hypothetical protein
MKDIYQFEINSSGCNYEIWLNDIRIDIQLGDMPIVYDLPVNQWINNGENNLQIKILPLSDKSELEPKAYFKLIISQGSLFGKVFSKLYELKNIETPSFQELKQKSEGVDLSSFLLSYNFVTDFQYSNPVFSELNSFAINKAELVTFYKTISEYFQNEDLDALMGLMKFKMKGFSKSYQDRYEDELERQMFFLKDLFGKKIEPVNYEEYNIKYFLNNKIVCLEDKEGDQPLFFSDDIDDSYIFYPFYFSIIGGKIQIVM